MYQNSNLKKYSNNLFQENSLLDFLLIPTIRERFDAASRLSQVFQNVAQNTVYSTEYYRILYCTEYRILYF